MTTYMYGQQQQQPARAYVIDPDGTYRSTTKVTSAPVAVDEAQNASLLGPLVVSAAICGTLSFLVTPVLGLIPMIMGVRSALQMSRGALADAHSSAKTALTWGAFAVVIAIVAFVTLSVMRIEKPDWFTGDNLKYANYIPRVTHPLFAWVPVPYID